MKRSSLTIVFEVQDIEAAKAFWDALGQRRAINGLLPYAVSWGDCLAESQAWEDHCFQLTKLMTSSHSREAANRLNEWTEAFFARQKGLIKK